MLSVIILGPLSLPVETSCVGGGVVWLEQRRGVARRHDVGRTDEQPTQSDRVCHYEIMT